MLETILVHLKIIGRRGTYRLFKKIILNLVLFSPILFSMLLQAENWTMRDVKTYKDVTVVKVEPEAVTILCADGGARVLLSMLSTDLQARFHYDPEKAKGAFAKHDAEMREADLEAKKVTDAKAAANARLPSRRRPKCRRRKGYGRRRSSGLGSTAKRSDCATSDL
jgi:hypothetical protein